MHVPHGEKRVLYKKCINDWSPYSIGQPCHLLGLHNRLKSSRLNQCQPRHLGCKFTAVLVPICLNQKNLIKCMSNNYDIRLGKIKMEYWCHKNKQTYYYIKG